MQNLKILNSKEIKVIMREINDQWGFDKKLDYVFLKNNKDKIFITTRNISKIDLDKIRINSIGLYFCEISNGLRLSMDGSQIIGPGATKNVAEINKETAKKWINGENIEFKENKDQSSFQIIKYGDDFLGTGRLKNGIITNFIPKARRVNIKE